MRIQSNLPLAFSRIGQRSINQDAMYPSVNEADEQTQLFIVCDGMGGADKGEVASQLLRDGLADYASAMGYPILDQVHLQTALDRVYQTYHDYLRQHPLISRMGSTLALLQFHENGASVAHIGDSRIYQLRAGKIIFRTKDHKQVNDMVDAGIITELQAQTHPWRNRLSRAVVVSAGDAEMTSHRATPDFTQLTDIQAGDYFFICTDGVLEQLDDAKLEELLSGSEPDQTKLASLIALCDGQTKDNYSAYLIGVRNVTQNVNRPEPTVFS